MKIVDIAAGGHHSLAVTAQGELLTWGRGVKGCLGELADSHQLQPAVPSHHIASLVCAYSTPASAHHAQH